MRLPFILLRACPAAWRVGAAGLLCVLPGCGVPTSLDSPESASRIRAIHQASAANDHSSVPRLIALLESDDPAVRFFAVGTLERLTGTRRGYDPTATEDERAEAVRRWQQWYESGAGGAVSASP